MTDPTATAAGRGRRFKMKEAADAYVAHLKEPPTVVPATAALTVAAIRERFANADAFITNYGDRQESALFAEAKFLLAELDRVAVEARRKALTEAWQVVDRAVRPLGTECGQSRWNAGYTQARDEAQNAILALRDEAKP